MALSVRNFAIQAGDRLLLHGVTLTLEQSERLALVGRSGLGKTQLLRAIAGLSDARSGALTLHDRSPEDWGWPQWRRRVGYCHQRPVMFPGTVAANLTRAARFRSAGTSPLVRNQERLLDRLGMSAQQLTQRADALSIGEQQRVALLRSLLTEPEVLLLDEPTSALDPTSRELIERLITERCEEGLAVVVVTHDEEQAKRWCQRRLDLRAFEAPSGGGSR